MTKQCEGCGSFLQLEHLEKEGYVQSLDHTLCERCFRIRNYNEYKSIVKDNQEFISLLKKVDATGDLVLFVVDTLQMQREIAEIAKMLHNPILLVLTKKDLLPHTMHHDRLLEEIDRFGISYVDKIMISSRNNDHFDALYEMILKYKKSQNVYVVGLTNAGKSTMMNQLIYHYGEVKKEITTSMLSSTTMNFIAVPISDQLTLIDTPGILDRGNMVDVVDYKTLKKMTPKVEIKPRTYQIKENQSHVIEDLVRIDYMKDNNVTYYIANPLQITRYYKQIDHLKHLCCREIKVGNRQDIVISGFGFIKLMKACIVNERVLVYTRDALI